MKLRVLLTALLILLFPTLGQADIQLVAATSLTGGGSGSLDAIECNDIKGDNTNISIQTGDVAIAVTATATYYYHYNASSTASENAPNVIVPDDRSDCSNQGAWELKSSTTSLGTMLGKWSDFADPAATRLLIWNDSTNDFEAYVPSSNRMIYFGASAALGEISFGSQYSVFMSGGPTGTPYFGTAINFNPLLVPKATLPNQTTLGSMKIDSDDFHLTLGDGATTYSYGSRTVCWTPTVIYEPDVLDASTEPTSGTFPIKDFPSYQFPGGVTLTAIIVESSNTCADSIQIEEWSNNGTSWSNVSEIDAITLAGTKTTETTITDPNVAADNVVMVDLATAACNVDWIKFTLCGRTKVYD